jgi:hypothetical protein
VLVPSSFVRPKYLHSTAEEEGGGLEGGEEEVGLEKEDAEKEAE